MFIQKTSEELVDDTILALATSPGPLTDFSSGSIVYTLTRAFMSVVARGYVDMNEGLNASFIETASGDYLSRHTASFGVVRRSGSRSTGSVIAIAKPGATPTPLVVGGIGLVEGSKVYNNTTTAVLTPPYTIFPVQAADIGNEYDLPAGTSLRDQSGLLTSTWDFVVGSGFDLNNTPVGFLTGGSGEETDDQLRTRFIEFINSLSRGTERAVRAAISAVPGVESFVLREFDPGVGWFSVYVDDGTDSTSPVLLTQVQQALDNTKALGIAYQVLPMIKQFVDMTIVLKIDGNLPAQPIIDTVKTQIRNTLAAYAFGDPLYLSKIDSICHSVPGVLEVNITTPTAPIIPPSSTAIRAGVLNVSTVV